MADKEEDIDRVELKEDDFHLQTDDKDTPGKMTNYDGLARVPELRPSKIGLVDNLKERYLYSLGEGRLERAFWYLTETFDLFEGVNPAGAARLKKEIEAIISSLLERQAKAEAAGTRPTYSYLDLRNLSKKINKFLNAYLNYMQRKNYEVQTRASYEEMLTPEGSGEEKQDLAEDLENNPNRDNVNDPHEIKEDLEEGVSDVESQMLGEERVELEKKKRGRWYEQ